MVSPIDKNSPRAASSDLKNDIRNNDIRTNGVESLSSPAPNIPNADENYHWFLPEISGSRLTISPSNFSSQQIGQQIGQHIRADMSIKNLVSRILSHVGT